MSLGAIGGAALAQVKPEILVKQRQSAMTLIGKYFGPLGGMAQGKVPFDAKIVQRNAEYLARPGANALGRFRREHQER